MGSAKTNSLIVLLFIAIISAIVLLSLIFKTLVTHSELNLDYITRSITSDYLEDVIVIDSDQQCPPQYINLLEYDYPGHQRGCYCRKDKILFEVSCSESKELLCDINIDFKADDHSILEKFPAKESQYFFKICGKYTIGQNINEIIDAESQCDLKKMKKCGRLCLNQESKCPATELKILDINQDKDYIDQNNIFQNNDLFTVYQREQSTQIFVLVHSKSMKNTPLSSIRISKLPFICQQLQISQEAESTSPFERVRPKNCQIDDLHLEIEGSLINGSQYLLPNLKDQQTELTELYNQSAYRLYQRNSIILSSQCLADPSNYEFIKSLPYQSNFLELLFIVSAISTFLISVYLTIYSYLISKTKISNKCYQISILIGSLLLIITHLTIFLLYRSQNNKYNILESSACIPEQYQQIHEIMTQAIENLEKVNKLQSGNLFISLSLFLTFLLFNLINACCKVNQSVMAKPIPKTQNQQCNEEHNIDNLYKSQITSSNTVNTALSNIISNMVMSTNFLSSPTLKSESQKTENAKIELTQ